MASCFFFLHFHFIIFIILLSVSLSNSENINYTACSLLYSCGKIQNIGYPFWGDNRPKFCGIPGFKLSCKSQLSPNYSQLSPNYSQLYPNDSYINIFQYLQAPVEVLNINIFNHTIVVSQGRLFERCRLDVLNNATFLSTLRPDADYRNITLFYNCDCVSKYHPKSFTCSNKFDNTPGTAYFFDELSNISRIGKSCSCPYNATFLMDKRGLDELRSANNASFFSDLKYWSNITLEYKANFPKCSKCEQSGGRCGSSEGASSDQFVCYCRDGTHQLACPKSGKKLEKVLGLGVGGGVIVLVAITAMSYRKKLKSAHSKFKTRSVSLDISASDLEKGSRYFGVPLFSYSDLVAATDSFDQSKELGSGGFGTVYHGKLKDGREVAVKRLHEKNYKRMVQFMNEVQILTRLRHQSLVSLYGCTSHQCRELLLVYEYVENGTVADQLYNGNTKSGLLPWPVRLKIAIETATALSYLHASDIIHRDVKTSNILLDRNFSAKVADFGLSRLFPTDRTHVSTAPQGTPGYLDPEYHLCYQLTDKSDVYSFGVVLIELISSLPAIDMERNRLEINLSNYAMNRIQRCAFDELVDPQLGFALDFKVRRMTTLVAELAFQCMQHDKEFRPSMDEVLQALKRIEGADYEALQAEEMAKNAEEEVVKMHSSNPPPPLPRENDHAQLLSNHQLHPPSPISVTDKWVSRSTASNSSK